MTANIYYDLNGNLLTYTIIPIYRDASAGYDIEDKEVDEYSLKVKNVEIKITEYVIQNSLNMNFQRNFSTGDVSYFLTGVIEKNEFEKILENLHFF